MKIIIDPYRKKLPVIDSVKITKEAFKKMNLYANIVSEIIGGDKECLGTLLNYKNKNDNIARDIHLWKDQVVDSASGSLGDPLDDCTEAKRRGMDLIGLWHSHGGIRVSHSSDDNNVLSRMYQYTKNKIVTSEKERNIECIVEGESVRLFEEGSNKELRLKINGNIDNIEYIESNCCYVLNSIVINRNSYFGGYVNPQLGHDYDAEIWVGYDKKDCKRVEHASVELIDETNSISLNEEELVKEVGEKVVFQGTYLKELPNYQNVLDKYEKENSSREKIESIDQVVEESSTDEDKKKVSLESVIPSVPKTIPSGNGYYKKMYEFFNVKKADEDIIISKIGLIGEILAGYYHEKGQKYWLWENRVKKVEEVYKEIKGKICKKQYLMLGNLLEILNINSYAKKRHGKKLDKLCKKMGFKNKIKVKKSNSIFSKILRRHKK